jgi:plastocyanin/LysM repeat protein
MKALSNGFLAAATVVLLVAIIAAAAFPVSAQAANRVENSPHSPAPAWFSCVHVVRFGETLFSVALMHGTSPYMLAYMNGMSNVNFIFVGIVLRVPCVVAFQSQLYQPPIYQPSQMYQPSIYQPSQVYQPQSHQPQSYANICNIHFVQRGEWLKLIAARFGVPWQVIAAVNRLPNPNLIFPGERLLISCPSSTQPYAPGVNPYVPGMNPYAQPPPAPAPMPMPGQTTNVTIQDFMFMPPTITIHVGQTVMWLNNGPSMHTSTSDTSIWNSGTLGVGGTFSRTFNSTGTFSYHCAIHPFMHATVFVMP